jgi:hypothetical protein
MLTGAFWHKVSAAGAGSIKATVYSEFFTDTSVGDRVPARISTDAGLENLDCVATEQSGRVSCQFPAEYAGQQMTIELTKNKIMHVYVVDVPKN